MDAAQMLTAQEIARQCEEMARLRQRRDSAPARRLRPVDAVTEPLPRIPAEPAAERRADRELTELELGVLAFERQWWKHPGGKERAIRELFDLSAARYYRLLDELLDDPAAARSDPMLVKRLRKVRASRQRARRARQLGIEWD